MSNLSQADKQYLESSLRMFSGNVLNLSDKTFKDIFLGYSVNIDDPLYLQKGTSKADKFRTFCEISDNEVVGNIIIELAGHIRNSELAGHINKHIGFSEQTEKIGRKLLEASKKSPIIQSTSAGIENNQIHIEIRPEIYEHIKRYFDTEDYFHAVDEAYKVVREKLRTITTKERASDIFNLNSESNRYHTQLFGSVAEAGTPESDFFRGIGYIHLAIQFLRNEKAHSLASNLDRNLAGHYLSLASLAYDLISRNNKS